MIAVLAAVAAAYGAHLLYTALALRWEGVGPGPSRTRTATRERTRPSDWLAQAGLGSVAVGEFAVVIAVVFVLGASNKKELSIDKYYVDESTGNYA